MTNTNRKILLLGVGSAQADAILGAKRLGCEVYAVAYKREGPGLAHTDHFEKIDIVDRDGVLQYAQDIACDAVYSVGSDIAMPTVSYVAQSLGLPCPVPHAVAELLNHKGNLRNLLVEHGLWSLRHAVVSSASELADWDKFPAIVKPVDSQGGRGVTTVQRHEDLPDLIEHALTFSLDGKAIVEEFVTGSEFSINAFLRDGEMIFAVLTDRFVDMTYPCGVATGHGLPARIPDIVRDRAVVLASSVVQAANLHNGPAYFQLKHVGDEVFLIEATPRLDGCHIWRLIDYMYGIDLLEASLRVALGERVDLPREPTPQYEELHLDFSLQRPGTLFKPHDTSGEDILYREWYYKEGEKVRPINSYSEKVGYQVRVVGEARS